ncbi:MAG: DUF1566 domain-containing protein [Methylomonas sp.]
MINTIVNDESAIINTSYGYNLTSNDFGGNGLVDWYAAHAYVNYLDSLNNGAGYGGSNQWALPYIVDSSSSLNWPPSPSNSQLAELFYNELNGAAGSPIPTGPFSNVQSYVYWSGTEYSALPSYAWIFMTNAGNQGLNGKDGQFYAWAVSPGQVSAVPVSGAVWLFGSAIAGFGMLGRRKSTLAV